MINFIIMRALRSFLTFFYKSIMIILSYLKKNENKMFIIKTLNDKNEIKFLAFKKRKIVSILILFIDL